MMHKMDTTSNLTSILNLQSWRAHQYRNELPILLFEKLELDSFVITIIFINRDT